MKVKTSAFALEFENTNIFEFLRYLQDNAAYTYQHRILVTAPLNEDTVLWGGYLLNLREERTMPHVKLTERDLEVIITEASEDIQHGEFNFFLMNTNTRKGLFQTHPAAARWTAFAGYLNHRFNNFTREKNVRQATFHPRPIFRQETFEEYLEQFEWIKEIKIETSHYEVEEPAFQRLREEAQRRVEIFKFYKGKKWNLRAIKKALSQIYNGQKAEDLKIGGTIGGAEQIYTFANNIEVFYEEEYKEWISKLKFDNKSREKSVNSSQTIRDLLRIYKQTLPTTRLDKRD